MAEVEAWSSEIPTFPALVLETLGITLVDIKEVVEMDWVTVDDTIIEGDAVGPAGRTLLSVTVLEARVLTPLLCKGTDVVKVWIDVRSWEGFMWLICWVGKGWRWDLSEEEFTSFWMECLLIWRRLNPDIPVTFIPDLFIASLLVVTFTFWDNEVTVRDIFLVLGVQARGRALKSFGKFKSLREILTRIENMADGMLFLTSGGMVAGLLDFGRNSISNSPMCIRQGGG